MNAEVKIQNGSDYVFDLIEEIASTSSKNAKIELIRSSWHHNLFSFCIKQALDPFITFGMKKIPKYKEGVGFKQFTFGTVGLLTKLNNRELTGNAAKEAVQRELESLTPNSAELLKRIIAKKLKAGFTESTVNEAVPGAIYVFKAMLSHKLTDRIGKKGFDLPEKRGQKLENPWYAELKEDGVRGFSRSKVGGEFVSREGKPLNAGRTLREEVMTLFSMWREYFGMGDLELVLDGELDDMSGVFNETVGSVHRKDADDNMGVKVIDIITQDQLDEKLCPIPYIERRSNLEKFFAEHGDKFTRIKLIPKWEIHSVEEAMELFESLNNSGEEGLIVKTPDGPWEAKRSYHWLKIKAEQSVDLVVKRIEKGTDGDKYAHCMGMAICDYVNSKGETVEVSVGGGWTDHDREYYWNNPDELIGVLIEVQYHEETLDGSLRHPRFKRIRDDKPVSDGQGV